MQNIQANREIKQKLYELFMLYPDLDAKDVLAKLETITKEVKKQVKEVKK
jgi:hypothetical protein